MGEMQEETKKRFTELIGNYKGIIYKVAFMYADNAADREDLYQEIILQAWRSFAGFKGKAAFSTWLYQVALNTAIAGFKKQKRYDALFVHTDQLPDHSDPQDDDGHEQQLKLLKQAINSLNEIEKAVVMLFLEGQSYEKMEAITGISSGTLRVKMNRIKEKLRTTTKAQDHGN